MKVYVRSTKLSQPIWEKPWREYSGSDRNYQWLIDADGNGIARITGWDDDGDFGFDAEIGDSNRNMKFLGTFHSRKDAQQAIAKELGLDF